MVHRAPREALVQEGKDREADVCGMKAGDRTDRGEGTKYNDIFV